MIIGCFLYIFSVYCKYINKSTTFFEGRDSEVKLFFGKFFPFLSSFFSYLLSKLSWRIEICYIDLVKVVDIPFEGFNFSTPNSPKK